MRNNLVISAVVLIGCVLAIWWVGSTRETGQAEKTKVAPVAATPAPSSVDPEAPAPAGVPEERAPAAPVAAAGEAPEPTTDTTDWEALDTWFDELADTPFDALTEEEWMDEAVALRERYRAVDAASCQEKNDNLGTIVALLQQTGRAAENANDPESDFYGGVGEVRVNAHWHLGASFLHEANLGVDPDDPDILNVPKALMYHQRLIDQGRIPVLGLCDARG